MADHEQNRPNHEAQQLIDRSQTSQGIKSTNNFNNNLQVNTDTLPSNTNNNSNNHNNNNHNHNQSSTVVNNFSKIDINQKENSDSSDHNDCQNITAEDPEIVLEQSKPNNITNDDDDERTGSRLEEHRDFRIWEPIFCNIYLNSYDEIKAHFKELKQMLKIDSSIMILEKHDPEEEDEDEDEYTSLGDYFKNEINNNNPDPDYEDYDDDFRFFPSKCVNIAAKMPKQTLYPGSIKFISSLYKLNSLIWSQVQAQKRILIGYETGKDRFAYAIACSFILQYGQMSLVSSLDYTTHCFRRTMAVDKENLGKFWLSKLKIFQEFVFIKQKTNNSWLDSDRKILLRTGNTRYQTFLRFIDKLNIQHCFDNLSDFPLLWKQMLNYTEKMDLPLCFRNLSYKCVTCKYVLFDDLNVLRSSSDLCYGPKTPFVRCDSIFVEPLSWMFASRCKIKNNFKIEGQFINCPHCDTTIGHYCLLGMKCHGEDNYGRCSKHPHFRTRIFQINRNNVFSSPSESSVVHSVHKLLLPPINTANSGNESTPKIRSIIKGINYYNPIVKKPQTDETIFVNDVDDHVATKSNIIEPNVAAIETESDQDDKQIESTAIIYKKKRNKIPEKEIEIEKDIGEPYIVTPIGDILPPEPVIFTHNPTGNDPNTYQIDVEHKPYVGKILERFGKILELLSVHGINCGEEVEDKIKAIAEKEGYTVLYTERTTTTATTTDDDDEDEPNVPETIDSIMEQVSSAESTPPPPPSPTTPAESPPISQPPQAKLESSSELKSNEDSTLKDSKGSVTESGPYNGSSSSKPSPPPLPPEAPIEKKQPARAIKRKLEIQQNNHENRTSLLIKHRPKRVKSPPPMLQKYHPNNNGTNNQNNNNNDRKKMMNGICTNSEKNSLIKPKQFDGRKASNHSNSNHRMKTPPSTTADTNHSNNVQPGKPDVTKVNNIYNAHHRTPQAPEQNSSRSKLSSSPLSSLSCLRGSSRYSTSSSTTITTANKLPLINGHSSMLRDKSKRTANTDNYILNDHTENNNHKSLNKDGASGSRRSSSSSSSTRLTNGDLGLAHNMKNKDGKISNNTSSSSSRMVMNNNHHQRFPRTATAVGHYYSDRRQYFKTNRK